MTVSASPLARCAVYAGGWVSWVRGHAFVIIVPLAIGVLYWAYDARTLRRGFREYHDETWLLEVAADRFEADVSRLHREPPYPAPKVCKACNVPWPCPTAKLTYEYRTGLMGPRHARTPEQTKKRLATRQ